MVQLEAILLAAYILCLTNAANEFYWLSKEACLLLQKEDEGLSLSFQCQPTDLRCLHLLRSMMGMEHNVVWGKEEEEGCDLLV